MSAAPDLILGPDAGGRRLAIGGGRVVDFADAESGAAIAVDQTPCPEASIEAGRVNAHTHIYSALAPLGMPPPDPAPENFPQILERVWWRLDRSLDERAVTASARLYAAEALLAGTTTLIDHHESPRLIGGSLDLLADACHEIGIRAVLCFGATERNGGREEARRGLAECRRFLETNRRPAIAGVVGLHASFTVSDETIREAGDLCRELDTVLHVHLAEDGCDVEDARERGYPGPLERLLALDALPPGSILAHGVHLTEEQVRLTAAHGLWLVQNPRSNRGNRVGYPAALAASPRVALGTDGYPARMADEEQALFEEAAAHDEPRRAAEARPLGGTRLAAQRFGLPFAPLAPGAAADAVAAVDGEAREVVVAGRRVVGDGRLLTADYAAIRREAEAAARRLWTRMETL